jgi:3-oxoacyl-[acyl-carrier-protein] synthase III
MAAFQTNPDTISQEMVTRVGSAAGLVARIQQEYAVQAEAESGEDGQQDLIDRARTAAERAIDDQGISVEDYNSVLEAAQTDPDLERRLVDAAREVL